jgi:hypothetical protein
MPKMYLIEESSFLLNMVLREYHPIAARRAD